MHLINRLPTPVLQGKNLFSILFCKDHTYDYLRVLECFCYPYLHLFNGHKLELRSEPCTVLGYSSRHKGYQCLLANEKIVLSRHVVFDESRFLFSESSSFMVLVSDKVTMSVPIMYHVPSSSVMFPSMAPVTVQPMSLSISTCPSNPMDRQVDAGVVLASPCVSTCPSNPLDRQVDTGAVLTSLSVSTCPSNPVER